VGTRKKEKKKKEGHHMYHQMSFRLVGWWKMGYWEGSYIPLPRMFERRVLRIKEVNGRDTCPFWESNYQIGSVSK
jgi:hypothetical protein